MSAPGTSSAPRPAPAPEPVAPIAYFWGEDAFAIGRAVAAFAVASGDDTLPLDVWQSPAEDDSGAEVAETGGSSASKRRQRALDEAESRLGTAPLFGGGTLVVIRQPGWLLRESASAQRTLSLIRAVSPGNALAFSDLIGNGGRGPAAAGALREAVIAAGGTAREFPALTRERLESWIVTRGSELAIRVEPEAARLLAERVGGYVRESDVDRRRQSELANSELEKLALYRPGGSVSREDVAELVTEAIPGSAWAFLDAVAAREAAEAAQLAARLLDSGTPLPVLVTQLHRRIRDLIVTREHLDDGARPPDLVRVMGMQPFRVQKLAQQASVWKIADLEAALHGLLELDLRSKGISLDGSTAQMSDARDALGLQLWIAEHAPRR